GRDLLRERLVEVAELLTLLEPSHELGGRADADVALDQRLLEPLPGGVVLRVECRDDDLLGERAPGARQRVPQPPDEAALRLLRLVRPLGIAEELSPAPRHGRRTVLARRRGRAASRTSRTGGPGAFRPTRRLPHFRAGKRRIPGGGYARCL